MNKERDSATSAGKKRRPVADILSRGQERFLRIADKLVSVLPEWVCGRQAVLEQAYRSIYGLRDWKERAANQRRKTAAAYLLLMAALLPGAVVMVTGHIAEAEPLQSLERPKYGEGSRSVPLTAEVRDGTDVFRQEMVVVVPEQTLTEPEKRLNLEKNAEAVIRQVTGGQKEEHITEDLKLPERRGEIRVTWTSDRPDLLDQDGSIDFLALSDPTPLHLTARLEHDGLQTERTLALTLIPPADGSRTPYLAGELARTQRALTQTPGSVQNSSKDTSLGSGTGSVHNPAQATAPNAETGKGPDTGMAAGSGTGSGQNSAPATAPNAETGKGPATAPNAGTDPDTDATLPLPSSTVNGLPLRWTEERSGPRTAAAVLFLLSFFIVWARRYKSAAREAERRKQSMRQDFPELVDQFVLLLSAGLVAETAFHRIAEEYCREREEDGPVRPLYENCKEVRERVLETNAPFSGELAEMARRSGLRELMRFAAVVEENLHRGNEMIRRLEGEGALLWQSRKKQAEAESRKTETKLTFPLALLLLALIIITTAPVFL